MPQKSIFLKCVFIVMAFGLAALSIFKLSAVKAQTLQDGDLVRTKDNPALYLIQNSQKKVFPHAAVYTSWGLPENFSTVKVVSDLSNYPEGEPVLFRDGSLFRGKTTSLYGQESSAVFFVSNGKLRPVKSSEIYQKLFNDPKWEKVKWIPDGLLSKFVYPMGEMIDSSDIHPDGSLVRYKGTPGVYLIENNKKRPITSTEILNSNRLNSQDVIEIEPSETYETGEAVQPEEEKLTLNIPNAIKNTTFVKTYRFYNFNQAWGVWPTKDGSYLLAGTTTPLDDDAFISKVNSQGTQEWTKLIKGKDYTTGPTMTRETGETGYLAIQLKDGSYLVVGTTGGFLNDEEFAQIEVAGDIFLSKFNQKGGHLWTKTVGDKAGDTPAGLWPTDDGGFLLFGTLEELEAGAEFGSDTDHYFFLAKFDKDGQKEWIKKTNLNIGGTTGTDEQVNFVIEREDDGGFVLTGTIPAKEVPFVKAEEGMVSSMPAVVKIDKNGQVIWAKSIESIPQEFYTALPQDGGYTMGYKKMRVRAGDFSAVQKTPDGGYIVFGFISPFVTQGYSAYNPTYETLLDTPLVAVKLDKNGNFKWAKTLKTGLYAFSKEFILTKTKDNDFILMLGFMPGGEESVGEKYNTYMEKAGEAVKLCQAKNCKPGDEENDPALKKAYEEMNKAQDEWLATFIKHIALIKVDPEFNVKWFKKIGPEIKPIDVRKGTGSPGQFIGNDIKIAQDQGIMIAGEHNTDVVCAVSFGIKIYCDDALFIKLDANGNLTDNSAGLVSEHTSVSQENLSQYITIRDLEPKINDYELGIKNRNPRLPIKTPKTTTLSAFKEKTVIPSRQSLSSIVSPAVPSQPKTWAERNYEAVEAIEPINEKSLQIHNELLLILNQLFEGEVKLRDNFGGISLDYTFGRLVTTDDVQAVKIYLEGLGYKDTGLSSTGTLVMSKIGLILNLGFSIKNRNIGTLEVSW